MPGGGSKPGERRGGRKPGSRNKAVLARLERERVLEQLAQKAGYPGAGKAVARVMEANRKLAKEEMEEVLPVISSIMRHFVDRPLGKTKAKEKVTRAEWNDARTWIGVWLDLCNKLAPYQSPTFRAIMVSTPPPEVPVPAGVQIEGDSNVVKINDPIAAARVYQRRVTAVRG